MDCLAKKGCPQSGQVAIIADVDERTRKTGEAFAAGLAPDCAITVHTQADTSSPDPLFNPLKTGVCQLDNANVTDAILSRAEGQLLTLPGIGKRRFANWNGCLISRNQTCALTVRKQDKKLFINAGITIGTQGERRQCLINRCGKPRINADGNISPATSTGNAGAGVGKDHRFTPVEHVAKFA